MRVEEEWQIHSNCSFTFITLLYSFFSLVVCCVRSCMKSIFARALPVLWFRPVSRYLHLVHSFSSVPTSKLAHSFINFALQSRMNCYEQAWMKNLNHMSMSVAQVVLRLLKPSETGTKRKCLTSRTIAHLQRCWILLDFKQFSAYSGLRHHMLAHWWPVESEMPVTQGLVGFTHEDFIF